MKKIYNIFLLVSLLTVSSDVICSADAAASEPHTLPTPQSIHDKMRKINSCIESMLAGTLQVCEDIEVDQEMIQFGIEPGKKPAYQFPDYANAQQTYKLPKNMVSILMEQMRGACLEDAYHMGESFPLMCKDGENTMRQKTKAELTSEQGKARFQQWRLYHALQEKDSSHVESIWNNLKQGKLDEVKKEVTQKQFVPLDTYIQQYTK